MTEHFYFYTLPTVMLQWLNIICVNKYRSEVARNKKETFKLQNQIKFFYFILCVPTFNVKITLYQVKKNIIFCLQTIKRIWIEKSVTESDKIRDLTFV